jgi:hypothetical protein
MFIEKIMHDCGIPLIGGGVDQLVDPSTSSIIFQCSDLEAFISRKPLVLEELSLSSISYTVDDPFLVVQGRIQHPSTLANTMSNRLPWG